MITWAPWLVSASDISGNEDSKQIRMPKFSRRPSGRMACSTRAPRPAIIFCAAARLIDDSHPSADRKGMYSPNGTRRVLVYACSMPPGPIRAATFDFWPDGLTASWLTSSWVRIEAESRWSPCRIA